MSISPLITIIVPVYNVEKYIERCIQSLLDQSYKDFEAIIVDDGSPDDSISIAKNLVGGDPRFVFLEKTNGGLSSARNYGLDHSSGDYIFFLDSDDYLDKFCFQKCFDEFQKNKDIDVVVFGHTCVSEQGTKLSDHLPNLKKYFDEKDIFLTNYSLSFSVWSRMYKKEVFYQLRFIEGLLYEDKAISYKLLYKKNIVALSESLYLYVQRDGSIMKSYNEKSLESYLFIYREYEKFLRENEIYDQYKIYYEKAYLKFCFFVELTHIFNYSPNFMEDYKALVSKIGVEKLTLLNVKRLFTIKSKFFIFACLLKLSPRLAKFLYKLTSQK